MPVTEYERHQLFTWFEEHMGSDRAATIMSLLPPVGWADIAMYAAKSDPATSDSQVGIKVFAHLPSRPEAADFPGRRGRRRKL